MKKLLKLKKLRIGFIASGYALWSPVDLCLLSSNFIISSGRKKEKKQDVNKDMCIMALFVDFLSFKLSLKFAYSGFCN